MLADDSFDEDVQADPDDAGRFYGDNDESDLDNEESDLDEDSMLDLDLYDLSDILD